MSGAQENLRQRRVRQSVGSFPVESDASPADSPRDVVRSNGHAKQKRKKPDKPIDDDFNITWRGW